MLEFCDFLPGDMIQDPNLMESPSKVSLKQIILYNTDIFHLFLEEISYLLIVAANGQELAAGAPGDRLNA